MSDTPSDEDFMAAHIESLKGELAACQAERNGVVRDAKRYRWLRSCSALDPQRHQPPDVADWWQDLGDMLDDDFDAAIDAAIKVEGEKR